MDFTDIITEDLTIGQADELLTLANKVAEALGKPGFGAAGLGESLIGKHVVVRARDASPFFGVLEAFEGRVVVLKEARRIYRYWSGGDEITLSGVAQHGMEEDSTHPKMTSALATVVIQDACEILECSDAAAKKLEAYRVATQD